MYSGPIGAWHHSLFWCGYNTGLLYHARLDAARTAIDSVEIVDSAPECRTDVQPGPDGALYLASDSSITRIRSTAPPSGERCFPETGYCISGRLREFWEQHSGPAVFGLPIGPARDERNRDTGRST